MMTAMESKEANIFGLKKMNKSPVITDKDIIYVDFNNFGYKGVFATRDIKNNEVFGCFDGYEVPNLTQYSLTFKGKYIEATGILKYLNHSCDPNSRFLDSREIISKRNISAKEEITINYLETESKISSSFKCNCGAKNCRGII
jgi:hypothetical protein